MLPKKKLQSEKTTLGDILLLLGAPDDLHALKQQNVLVYERMVCRQNSFSLGIPMPDVLWPNADLAAYGTLVRYDRLVVLFSSNGILQNVVFEKGSDHPYLKALFVNK